MLLFNKPKQAEMRKFYFTIAIVVSCLVLPSRLPGQGVVTNPDQMKLMKQFLGEWQATQGKDTVLIVEIKQAGEAFVETDYLVIRGEKSVLSFWNYYYDADMGKFKIFALNTQGEYGTYMASFTSEKEWVQTLVPDFMADKILRKDIFIFISSSEIRTTSFTPDGKKRGEGRFTRIK